MRVASTPGAGSTFVVEVPLVSATGEPDAAKTPTDRPTTGEDDPTDRAREARERPLQVLVAEDNPINQMVIEAMLESMGCDVRLAEDGREALDALDEDAFDLVFMDCQMPRVDGYVATREARGRGCRVPIIAVTANVLSGDRERCLDAGMDDYLAKPFTDASLAGMLERWGSDAAGRDAVPA